MREQAAQFTYLMKYFSLNPDDTRSAQTFVDPCFNLAEFSC